ncbi:hypothetical protein D3C80_1695380 [compost metagenome]
MLLEIHDLDDREALRLVAIDEASLGEAIQPLFHIVGVAGEKLHLDALGPVLKAAFPIGKAPHTNEQQAVEGRELSQ